MKRNLSMLLALLGMIPAWISARPWWNADWRYRFQVRVQTGATECIDRPVEHVMVFANKFAEVQAEGALLDPASIRIIETDSSGRMLAERSAQYDVDELVWILNGSTPPATSRFFDVYFNGSDRSVPRSSLPPLVAKRDSVDRWIFDTPAGHYVFEQRGGAFEVFSPVICRDNEGGKDWMRDDYNRWNGILNVGDPRTKAIFHPNEDDEADDSLTKGPKSFIQCAGPVRYRLKSINRFGELDDDYRSKTVYSIEYMIYPHGIRARMLQGNKDGYACIMELTPGGDQLEASDYVVGPDGVKKYKGETWAKDISPEWLYVGDEQDPYKLYFFHAEDDTIKDGLNWYENMQAAMVGWGRGANPGIHTYPNTFYMGFTRAETHEQIKKRIESWQAPLTVSAGKTETAPADSWGQVRIEGTISGKNVVLENSRLRIRYSTTQTANPETAITELLNKAVRENQAGKHIDEMARDWGRDRGLLSSGTSIVYDGVDKKTVHLEWDDGASIEEITLYPDQPFVRIDYLNTYANICDIGNPGGTERGRFAIYGAKAWQEKRKKRLADPAFRNSDHPHHVLTDSLYPTYPHPILGDWGIPAAENPMNYKGWYIFGVYNPENGHGYGRVIPADAVDHIKLLSKNGFEQFPFWFDKQRKRPFANYLFVVSKGEREIFALGKEIVERANREPWYRENSNAKTIGNVLLECSYGPDRKVQGLYMSGLTRLVYRPTNENLAQKLDVSGCGYAQYHAADSYTQYQVTARTPDFIDARVVLKGCVDIDKTYRIYRDLPLLEIRYDSLKILWWEDFYTEPANDRRVYTIYGIADTITAEKHALWRQKAEDTCGHNFGDCFLHAAGASVQQCTYKGFFIFGFYDLDTGRGLGFVMPEHIGLHGGFKLWSMYNYETFPFVRMEKKLPLTRWIFVTGKGRDGILNGGKALADMAADGKTLVDVYRDMQFRF